MPVTKPLDVDTQGLEDQLKSKLDTITANVENISNKVENINIRMGSINTKVDSCQSQINYDKSEYDRELDNLKASVQCLETAKREDKIEVQRSLEKLPTVTTMAIESPLPLHLLPVIPTPVPVPDPVQEKKEIIELPDTADKIAQLQVKFLRGG